MPWCGKVIWMSRRMAISAARSASVTGSNMPPAFLSSAAIAVRKNGKTVSAAMFASFSTKAVKSTAVMARNQSGAAANSHALESDASQMRRSGWNGATRARPSARRAGRFATPRPNWEALLLPLRQSCAAARALKTRNSCRRAGSRCNCFGDGVRGDAEAGADRGTHIGVAGRALAGKESAPEARVEALAPPRIEKAVPRRCAIFAPKKHSLEPAARDQRRAEDAVPGIAVSELIGSRPFSGEALKEAGGWRARRKARGKASRDCPPCIDGLAGKRHASAHQRKAARRKRNGLKRRRGGLRIGLTRKGIGE